MLDEYVSVKPGEPFRLFPFGKLVKGGVIREITRELAAKFKLPQFKPPIKLGSHKDETPAGGHIVRLEVRSDGLYAIPELTEKGRKAWAEGDYKYCSPEVIWEDGVMEDPTTGEKIPGPFIIGSALLHTPHLGEAAALYSIQPVIKEQNMSELIQVPLGFFDRLTANLFSKREVDGGDSGNTPPPDTSKDELSAAIKERDEMKAKITTMEAEKEAMDAEKEKAEKLTAIGAEFEIDKYGAAYTELGKAEGVVDMLASMTDEQQEWVHTQLRAFSAQIKEGELTDEKGSTREGKEGADEFELLNSKIEALAAEKSISYNDAYEIVKKEK